MITVAIELDLRTSLIYEYEIRKTLPSDLPTRNHMHTCHRDPSAIARASYVVSPGPHLDLTSHLNINNKQPDCQSLLSSIDLCKESCGKIQYVSEFLSSLLIGFPNQSDWIR